MKSLTIEINIEDSASEDIRLAGGMTRFEASELQEIVNSERAARMVAKILHHLADKFEQKGPAAFLDYDEGVIKVTAGTT